MNMKLTIITSVLLVAASSASAFAAPISVDSAEGLLGSPAVQPPAQDPVLQKAIEWIQSKQQKPEMQKTNPQNTIGGKPATQRRLILGGPEIIPM
jgi:hypothetical protein